MRAPGTVVLAFGGNALIPEGADGSFDEQLRNTEAMAQVVCALVDAGCRVVVTHGNGPQVGNLALQQEEAADVTPAQPLHALVAMTQGYLGHLFSQAIRARDASLPVAVVATHVAVDADDPAFDHPTKPIGPFYDGDEARALAEVRGWQVAEQAGGRYRRVVASPRPRHIEEADQIRSLVEAGCVVVAAGGGGIPLTRRDDGLVPVDAVIDKDLAAERLATMLSADALVLVTGVPAVAVDFGTPDERALPELTVEDAEEYMGAGQFPAGSMGPKVEAGVTFLRNAGDLAVITSAEHVVAALHGGHGTRIVRREAQEASA